MRTDRGMHDASLGSFNDPAGRSASIGPRSTAAAEDLLPSLHKFNCDEFVTLKAEADPIHKERTALLFYDVTLITYCG